MRNTDVRTYERTQGGWKEASILDIKRKGSSSFTNFYMVCDDFLTSRIWEFNIYKHPPAGGGPQPQINALLYLLTSPGPSFIIYNPVMTFHLLQNLKLPQCEW